MRGGLENAPLQVTGDAEIHDHHTEALYRQALLTLGDAGVAEQFVRDVSVDEYIQPRRNGGTQRMQPVMSRYRPSGAARSWQRARPGRTVGLARGSGGSFGRCCPWRRR